MLKISELGEFNTLLLQPESNCWHWTTKAYKQATTDYNSDKTLPLLDNL
jgi:hypothetical protein